MEGRAARIRPAQDDLQSVRPLEPSGRVQQDFRRAGGQGRQARADYDRCHPSKGAPHRRQPFKKGPVPRRIGRTKGGPNSKLHAVCDSNGRPLVMLLSEGQMSDFKGAALMLPVMPKAKNFWQTRATTPIGSAPPSPNAASQPASAPNPTGKSRSPMTPSSTNSVTRSKTCSAGSRIGGASTTDVTVALTPAYPLSASQQRSSSGCKTR